METKQRIMFEPQFCRRGGDITCAFLTIDVGLNRLGLECEFISYDPLK